MKQRKKPIDEHLKLEKDICKSIRTLRTLNGVSQDYLSTSAMLTRQQLQLYETGQTKITAGKLFRISEGLKVNVSSFFPNSTAPLDKLSDQELQLLNSFREVGQQYEVKEKVIEINEIITQLIKRKTS